MNRRASRRWLVGLGLGLGLGACQRSGDEELGLRTVTEPTIAVDRLTEPAMLLAALRQPGAELDARLGARGFDLTQALEQTGSDHGQTRTERVVQRVHVDADGRGALHLIRDLDHPDGHALGAKSEDEATPRADVDPSAQGMEAVVLPGRFFVRARYGRFVERRPEAGELDRVRALGERVLADDLALLAPFTAIEDRGTGVVLGRRTRKLALSRREAPRPVEAETDDPRRAWRAGLVVSELSGELEVDGETGAPLRAVIDARYRIARTAAAKADNTTSPLAVHLVLRQDACAVRPIEPPADAIASPHRSRITLERNQLLEGMAPALGTQAARP